MSNHLLSLGKIFRHMSRENLERTPIMLGNWVHPCQPGEMVLVKDWKKEPLWQSGLAPIWLFWQLQLLSKLQELFHGFTTPESQDSIGVL